jgi:hypothetical protein
MSDAVVGAALALAGIPLVGLPYGIWLRLRGQLLAVASWLLGAGLVAAGMLLLSVAHIGFSRISLGVLWVVLVTGGGLLASRAEASAPRHPWAGIRAACEPWPSPVSCALLAVCTFQSIYTVLQAVRIPLGSFDSWSLWEFKGRRFWLDGGVSGAFLHDHAIIFVHPGYPPLLPLLISWIYTWAGTPDPTLMKPLYPLFYCALLLAFYAALQVRLGPRWALLATAALSLVPRIADYAGTGLADVPLAAYLVAGSAAAATALQVRDARRMLAAGLLFGLAMCTKREGTLFFLAACGSLALLERSWQRLAAWLWPAIVVGLPWYLYVGLTGVPDRDFLPATPANLIAHAGRLGGIARLFALNMLAVDEWNILWFAFAAVLLLALLQRRLRAGVLLLPALAPLVLYVLALSLSAWPDPDLHVRTSLDRLILVTAPFALWFVCEQLVVPTSQQRPASRPP